MDSSLEQQLLELYQFLESPPTENLCGSCRICCTASGLTRQNVTRLELAVLGEAGEDFARYAARERGADGDYVFPVCPNLGPEGCRVYTIRPFSCRVFGHYRAGGTRLPSECVFVGKDREFPAADYYRVVPGALRLRELSRDFQLRTVPQRGTSNGGESESGVGLNLEDPWDRALEQVGRGELPDLPAESEGESLFAAYVRALVAGERGQHPEALRFYTRVVDACPERHDLMTFAGFHAFQLGLLDQAEGFWLRSLRLFSGNPLTFSFLGYLFSHRQEWQMAADFFGAAFELEPGQPVHRQRRDEALSKVAQA
ncbi:MAG: YkgJ family cysteine cluster protein [Candidatus Eremiobacteraeota bacterium]|nr:YkgJ family cysteine cluster protein [Candidatus Eremiobacteraeota bacterium]